MSIDNIILQHSTRGMDTLQNLYKKEFCKDAVKYFITLKKGVVFLYTGFWVAGCAETDGPIGTYFLYKALDKLGYTPIIITDNFCKDFFKDCTTIYIPIKGYTNKKYLNLLHTYNPIAHISIERCGKNINDKYENSISADISQYTAPLDELFSIANKTKPTFAIGDGGNEIGMGNLKNEIIEHLSLIPCKVKCDFLILASVSNWGAYGFIAYLQKYYKQTLLPAFEDVDSYLEYIVSLGSVDGIKKKQVKSVDGKDWKIEKEILRDLTLAI